MNLSLVAINVAMTTVAMYIIYMATGPTVGHLVWRLSMKWRAAVDSAVAPFGLTHAKYVVLASLREVTTRGNEPSQRELADFAGLDPVYVSKLAGGLERDGLIERGPDPHDTRIARLALTPRGVSVIDDAIAVVRPLMHRLTEPLGGSDGRPLAALARQLEELLAVQPAQ
jgi:MarR family transcriptional regulator, organic hydroperoxide resistance regulator